MDQTLTAMPENAPTGNRRSWQLDRATMQRALSDIQALRRGSFVRAGYEASKRLGGHWLVFGGTRWLGAPSQLSLPFGVPPAPIPAALQERALATARGIVGGTTVIFGRQVPLEQAPDWHQVIDRPARWREGPWWRVDVRSDARAGDVKWTWELARHRHVVLVARAVYLQPDDPSLSSWLVQHLWSWIQQNPPEHGVHWYSNLEIALRAISWMQVLALAGNCLPDTLVRAMTRHLYHGGRHLVLDLPYAASSVRNNHLLGDALGLVTIGQAFPDTRWGPVWARLGDRLFLRSLSSHFCRDGSTIEDSVGYHRFVLEMLAVRCLLRSVAREVRDTLAAGARHLVGLGAFDGPLPQIGDWDEGRVLVSTGDPLDVAGTARLALALAGSGAPDAWREEHDEVGWYAPGGVPTFAGSAEASGRDAGGGIARARSGMVTVWLKAGGGDWHGHADRCSTMLRYGDDWVIGDPGTGSYNGSFESRSYFRSSVAHSVLRLNGLDQLVPHRNFRWRFRADGGIGSPIRVRTDLPSREVVAMWGFHTAYRRLQPPHYVVRVVLVRSSGIVVADWVEGPGGQDYQLSLPLSPSSRWTGQAIVLGSGEQVYLAASGTVVPVGPGDPWPGRWSRTYGHIEPAPRLELVGTVSGPVWWSVDTTSAGAEPPECDGDQLRAAGVTLRLEWHARSVDLVVDDGSSDLMASLALSDAPRAPSGGDRR